MSPVEELQFMDLKNFRRLGDQAKEITGKIEKKIEFLADESYKKRVEGIAAWRKSPINMLYLEMGQESISGGKKIEEIISNRKKSNQPVLSKEEFEAVMGLNKKLRY